MIENNKTLHEIPTQSLPVMDISVHINDLQEILSFFKSRGISTKNTRLVRYLDYFETKQNSTVFDGSRVFKNSIEKQFKSSIDWHLYTLREVHELMWILKGLKKHIPKGVDEKLELITSGRDFAALDMNSLSRNTQFELRIASYFCQTGCFVDLSTKTDIIALNKKYAFYTECKRIGSAKQVKSKLSYANNQLNEGMPRRAFRRVATGNIAVDVTKVAFQHNGLTFGITNEHSIDVIQKKLIEITNSIKSVELFGKNKRLIQLWLQIHISSLIMHPPTPATRFSSYFIFRGNVDRKEKKIIKAFKKMFEGCSTDDERASPSINR